MTAPEPMYLICKHGMYYRPNCQGYTSSTAEAGRYTMAEAEKETHPNGPNGPRDGMSYIPAPADLAAVQPDPSELTVWYGKMPESNGRENWTAILRPKAGDHMNGILDGFCFARSEYPDRVRYEADRMRWIIGELTEQPDILAYDADLHSGYVERPDPRDEVIARLVEALEMCPPSNNPQTIDAEYRAAVDVWWRNWCRAALAAAKAVRK